MVYTNLGYIRFGKGDVNICISIAGTADEPQAVLVFQNRDIPTEIGKIEEEVDCSQRRYMEYCPGRDFAMYFSKPESIDCLITALQTAKQVTFIDGSMTELYLKNKTEETG